MKATLASLVFLTSIGAPAAVAGPAPIAPDFVGTAPRASIDRSLAASGAMNRIDPTDVVTFTHASWDLSDPDRDQIGEAASWLKRNPRFKIVLEGHADPTGDTTYNADLALRRARAVQSQLISHGIDVDRTVVVVYGEAGTPADRRVVMFATDKKVRDVVDRQLAYSGALTALWTENGHGLQATSDRFEPLAGRTVVGRR
jgi:hypothetical protein